MVVWQGITEGGTAVPVQITEEGKVVAIGESGPQGPPGPEGPPGQAEWPPNPIEGAFLVWLNGEPTWYAEQPIPTPPGSAGPIIEVSDNSLLTFASDVDQNIFFQGVQVYAINADGSNWNGDGQYNTSQVWSADLSSSTGSFDANNKASNMFDGDISTSTDASAVNATLTFIPSGGISYSEKVEVRTGNGNAPYYKLNGEPEQLGESNEWTTLATGSGTVNVITCKAAGADKYNNWAAIRIDGQLLLDLKAGPYPTGQISVAVNDTVLLTRVQGVWTEGLYMKADESAQAAWLFSKNKNGKILG